MAHHGLYGKLPDDGRRAAHVAELHELQREHGTAGLVEYCAQMLAQRRLYAGPCYGLPAAVGDHIETYGLRPVPPLPPEPRRQRATRRPRAARA